MSGQCHPRPFTNGKDKAIILDSSLDEEETTDTSGQDSDGSSKMRKTVRRTEKQKFSTDIKEMTMVVNMIHIWMEKWNLMAKQIEENDLTIEILLERTEKLRMVEKENSVLKERKETLEDMIEDKDKTIQILKRSEERLKLLEKSLVFLQKENQDLTNKLVECNLIL